jgi:broad specificity phosphatase PhoE
MTKAALKKKVVTVYIARTGTTVWEEQGRVESAAGAPLSEGGVQEARRLAEELDDCRISAVYAPPGEAEQQTARILAKHLGVKRHKNDALREIDYGLWQGLTLEDIRRRHERVYRQWTKAPMTVQPPGGESLQDAQERLRQALRSILRKRKGGGCPLLVLRPVALTLLRSIMREEDVEALWCNGDPDFTWGAYETDDQTLSGT